METARLPLEGSGSAIGAITIPKAGGDLDRFLLQANPMTSPTTITSAITACIITLSLAAGHAAIVNNGDFETGDFTGWTAQGNVAVTSDADFRDFAGANGSFPTGRFAAQFGNGDSPATGVISQQFATIAGQEYRIALEYGRLGFGSGPQSIQLSLTNASDNALLFQTTITDGTGDVNLATLLDSRTYQFFASGPATELTFRDVSVTTHSTDGVLDNVIVTIVPEPGSFALLALGAGLTCCRRRRS